MSLHFSYQAFVMQHVFQMINCHMWLVAAFLETTHLEKCPVHRKWSLNIWLNK